MERNIHNLGNTQLQDIVQVLTSLVSAANSEVDVSKFKDSRACLDQLKSYANLHKKLKGRYIPEFCTSVHPHVHC